MNSKVIPFSDIKNMSKKCEITFIIGNGFDLGLGMKTKYTDVYDGYVKSPSSSDFIARFKKELKAKEANNYEKKAKEANNYEKWSDFEMGMASYARTLETENELIECVRDFKRFMVDHLKKENTRIMERLVHYQSKHEFYKECDRSLNKFYDGLIPNDITQIKSIIGENDIIRNYITFNYTTSLEALFSIISRGRSVRENTPIHIHGKLGEDVVLGVDNPDQLMGTKYDITKKVERAFIKTRFNKQFDNARVENAEKAIINSSIICVYGFSMGESDNTWVRLLSDWLLNDKKHHLVFYQHSAPVIDPYNYDEIMDIEDELNLELLKKLQIADNSVLEQIHIPVGKKLFKFSFQEIVPHTLKESTEFNSSDTYENKTFAMK